MKKLNLSLIFVLTFMIYSCEKENDNESNLNLDKVSGFVQKGPYLNGTAITISELTDDLTPTGKNFTSQILDNKGTFEIKNVNLTSQYIELKADGFYFNEVTNSNSSAQLTLFALSDLSNKSSLNVNILSNLEKNRVDYLVSNGTTFSEAKTQAQTEILSIFEITKEDIAESEQLDILKSGDDNAILLAVSVILQGYLTVSELSELLANISTDIREDGQLNSQTLGSTLINNARTIKLDEVRDNIESRCEELGLNTTIPDFEKYVKQFIDNTEFEFTNNIEYPLSISNLTNILSDSVTEINAGPMYCIGAELPYGTSLKVIFKPSPGYNCNGNGIVENFGWTKNITLCDSTNLEASGSDQTVYIEYMTGPISLDFKIFENGSSIPTISKTVIAN
jgi:hypothetical protein